MRDADFQFSILAISVVCSSYVAMFAFNADDETSPAEKHITAAATLSELWHHSWNTFMPGQDRDLSN